MPKSFIIWRDSICMADDMDAPHELVLSLENPTLRELTDALRAQNYLPSVMSGATWILQTGEKNARSLAVLTSSDDAPRFLVDAERAAWDYAALGRHPHFDLLYWCQVAAERVFDALQNGENLPDKYGR